MSATVERCDVVVVGARCAGSPIATLLARQGLKVVVLEQVTFPRNTLSSHIIQADALSFLDRLGVMDQMHAAQRTLIRGVDMKLEHVHFVADYPLRPGDPGGAACIRRFIFDPILADAAIASGADVRFAHKVVGLVREGERVAGVRVKHERTEYEIRAPLVIGADGTRSTVAKQVGARSYNVHPNERWYYFAFFEGVDFHADPRLTLYRMGDSYTLACPADSDLYMVGVSPPKSDEPRFKKDLPTAFMDEARRCPQVANYLEGATRATKIYGTVRFLGYFREPVGPGWALVGDSAHFKDPSIGRGIGDAFMQGEKLVPLIVGALDGSGEPLDDALRTWAAWRDEKFFGHYWMAIDYARRGRLPLLAAEIIGQMYKRGQSDVVLDLFTHRSRYPDVVTARRVAGAVLSLYAEHPEERSTLMGELRTMLPQMARRRWVRTHPAYESAPVQGGAAAPLDGSEGARNGAPAASSTPRASV
jgi:flavin-dependent dehydrogenase